jgi:hypothetical protein
MFISPIDLVIVLAAVGFGGFYCWAQQRGLLTTGPAAEGEPGTRRISLLTEAAAYAGVILLLVGGVTAISQRWNDIGRGGQGGGFAAAAVFFFLVGIIVRQVREPAIQRLAGVAWFLSVAGAGGAVWLALYHVHGTTDAVTAVTFTPDGRALVTIGADQEVCLWDVTSGKLLRQFERTNH